MNAVSYRWLTAILALALLLSACQSATPAATLVPTIALATDAPGGPQATQPAVTLAPPGDDYPGPGDPQGVPAVDNLSQVTATLVSLTPDEANAGWVRLTATVTTSRAVEGSRSMTDDKVNQQIDIYAQQPTTPQLNPGDVFTALVSFDGDEQGGRYIAQEVYAGEAYP